MLPKHPAYFRKSETRFVVREKMFAQASGVRESATPTTGSRQLPSTARAISPACAPATKPASTFTVESTVQD